MTNSQVSVRQIARLLKRFHIEDGDIIALRHTTANANVQTIDSMTEALGKMGLNNVLVIVVDDFDDLKALDEKEMNKRGWFRLEKILRTRSGFQKQEESDVDKGSGIHV